MPFSRLHKTVTKPLDYKVIENPVSLGEKLLNKRLEFGLFQKDVAAFIGVCEDTVRLWESNIVKPFYKYCPNIIKFLGYNPFDFDETTLGGKLMKYQYIQGLSQKALAKRLEVDESTLVHYKNNKHKPTKKTMEKIRSLIE